LLTFHLLQRVDGIGASELVEFSMVPVAWSFFSDAYDGQLEVTRDRALPDGTPIASGANARAQSALSYGSEGLARAPVISNIWRQH